MKNKILGIVVPALAAVAVIGTGFATWQFTENGASASIGAKLEGYTNLGDITIKNAEYATLSLDASDTGDGITLEYDGATTNSATNNQIDFEFEVKQDLAREKSLELTTTISFESNLGSYIKLSAHNYDDTTGLGNEQSVETMSSDLYWTDSLTTSSALTQETFSLSTHLSFKWADGKEPDSLSDWEALNTIITNLTGDTAFTITYEIDYAS